MHVPVFDVCSDAARDALEFKPHPGATPGVRATTGSTTRDIRQRPCVEKRACHRVVIAKLSLDGDNEVQAGELRGEGVHRHSQEMFAVRIEHLRFVLANDENTIAVHVRRNQRSG